MGKKTTAKAAKKAKAAQKTERKEKKKVHKSKDKYDSEDEDDQDLEAILEKVWDCLSIFWNTRSHYELLVDEKGLGRSTYCDRRDS